MELPKGSPCACMVKGEVKPSSTWTYIHTDDIASSLERIERLGGKIVDQKKEIPGGHGFMAKFLDPFGNNWALHSSK